MAFRGEEKDGTKKKNFCCGRAGVCGHRRYSIRGPRGPKKSVQISLFTVFWNDHWLSLYKLLIVPRNSLLVPTKHRGLQVEKIFTLALDPLENPL